jgi:hypothetical protein
MLTSHSTGSKSDAEGFAPTFSGTSLRRATVVGLASLFTRCFAAVLLLGCSIAAQSPGVPPTLPAEGGQSTSRFPKQQSSDAMSPSMDQKRIAVLNRLRQKSIVNDTTRLLLLAQELNADSDGMSSADRVHKAAEIEKLAKSVKEKMSYAIGDNPTTPGYVNLFP